MYTSVGKILVTGSRGFIGSELIKYFQRKSYDIAGIDVDVRDKEALVPHFKNIEFVVHAAGKVKKGIPNPEIYHTINVLGTENVVQLCIENGCKLIHLSSVATEGEYGISKQVSQKLVEDYGKNRGLKTVILRLCVIYNQENDTGRRGARYPIERLSEDIENLIKFNDFDKYKLVDYSSTRA